MDWLWYLANTWCVRPVFVWSYGFCLNVWQYASSSGCVQQVQRMCRVPKLLQTPTTSRWKWKYAISGKRKHTRVNMKALLDESSPSLSASPSRVDYLFVGELDVKVTLSGFTLSSPGRWMPWSNIDTTAKPHTHPQPQKENLLYFRKRKTESNTKREEH